MFKKKLQLIKQCISTLINYKVNKQSGIVKKCDTLLNRSMDKTSK